MKTSYEFRKILSVALVVVFFGAGLLPGSDSRTIAGSSKNWIHQRGDRMSTCDGGTPAVEITRPKSGYLYIFDKEITALPAFVGKTIVLGKITFEASVVETPISGVHELEWYIDGELCHTDVGEVSTWTYQEKTVGVHTVGVACIGNDGSYNTSFLDYRMVCLRSSPCVQPSIVTPIEGSFVEGDVYIEAVETRGVNAVEHCLFEYSYDREHWFEIGDDSNGSNGWSAMWDTTHGGNGLCTVRATMFGGGNLTGSDRSLVYVNNDPPIAIASVASYDNKTGHAIFDGHMSHDIDGYVVNWTWSFGDGALGYGASAEHTYNLSEYQDLRFLELQVEDNETAVSCAHHLFELKNGALFQVTPQGLKSNNYSLIEGEKFEIYSKYNKTTDTYDYYVHNNNSKEKMTRVIIYTKWTQKGRVKVDKIPGWAIVMESDKTGNVYIDVQSTNLLKGKKQCEYLNIKVAIKWEEGDSVIEDGEVVVGWGMFGRSNHVDIMVPGIP